MHREFSNLTKLFDPHHENWSLRNPPLQSEEEREAHLAISSRVPTPRPGLWSRDPGLDKILRPKNLCLGLKTSVLGH